MSDTSILNSLLKPSGLVKIEPHYSKKKVTLIEPNENNSSFEIYNIPEDSLVIKIDQFPAPSAVFKSVNGVCKRADYLLISEKEKILIFIEMKSTTEKRASIISQLKGAVCVLEYMTSVVKHFWEEDSFLSTYRKKFVAIKHTKNTHKQTKKEKSEANTSPENMLEISFTSSLQYNCL